MDMATNDSLQDALQRGIDAEARKGLAQYFVAFKANLLDGHLPRVAGSTVAEDKFLFGYLSALGDLISALAAEPVGDEPRLDSAREELL